MWLNLWWLPSICGVGLTHWVFAQQMSLVIISWFPLAKVALRWMHTQLCHWNLNWIVEKLKWWVNNFFLFFKGKYCQLKLLGRRPARSDVVELCCHSIAVFAGESEVLADLLLDVLKSFEEVCIFFLRCCIHWDFKFIYVLSTLGLVCIIVVCYVIWMSCCVYTDWWQCAVK